MPCAQCGKAMQVQGSKPVVDAQGFLHDLCICPACGYTTYVPRTKQCGPCPKCHHVWIEGVRGNAGTQLAGEGF